MYRYIDRVTRVESGAAGSEREIGRWMILATWIVLVALLTLIFGNLIDKQANPNTTVETVVDGEGGRHVVLQRNRAGHYVATGLINDQPVTFLIDTGATDVALSSTLADKLKLIRGARYSSRTANGSVTAWQTSLARVALGGIEVRNVKASILPSLPEGEVLLGMSFLKHLELVQRDGELQLRQY
ncbi:MAG: TIGR02281 family clan AA aspartic protease [Candidatus Sedimenticola sp. (ex Thyasira tokunagai)]